MAGTTLEYLVDETGGELIKLIFEGIVGHLWTSLDSN
jgi:hypothetical protein